MESKKVRFVYSRSNDYQIIAVNGAYGSLATNGVIAVDFFVERPAVPEETEFIGYEDGIKPETNPKAKPNEVVFSREAQVGFLLTPETARAIGLWLMQKADECEAAKAQIAEEEYAHRS